MRLVGDGAAVASCPARRIGLLRLRKCLSLLLRQELLQAKTMIATCKHEMDSTPDFHKTAPRGLSHYARQKELPADTGELKTN